MMFSVGFFFKPNKTNNNINLSLSLSCVVSVGRKGEGMVMVAPKIRLHCTVSVTADCSSESFKFGY